MSEDWYKLLELLLDKLPWFVLVIAIYIFRDAISDLIKRLTNISFKNKDTSVSMVTSEASEKKDCPNNNTFDESNTVEEDTTENEGKEDVTTDEPWVGKMLDKFKDGEIDEAKEIFKTGIRTEEKDKQDYCEAIYLWCLYRYEEPDEEIISKIQVLVDNTDEEKSKFDLMIWINLCINSAKNYIRGVEYWQKAFTQFNDEKLKVECLINWTDALIYLEELENAKSIIIEHLDSITNRGKAELFKQLAKIEKKEDNKVQAAYCLDKAVEFDSSKPKQIFKAAYNEELIIDRRLSVANYNKILNIDPSYDYALNNLGVAASCEEFDYKAVQLYKQAGDIGVTLSLCNRANNLLNAGFVDEAEEIAQSVLKMDDPHKNVYSLLDRISKKRDTEEKGWKKYLNSCLEYQRYIRKYTGAFYQPVNNSAFSKRWKLTSNDEITSEVSKNQLTMTWEVDQFNYKVSAEINGQSIKGTYSKTKKDSEKYYTSSNESYEVLGYLFNEELLLFPFENKECKTLLFTLKDEN